MNQTITTPDTFGRFDMQVERKLNILRHLEREAMERDIIFDNLEEDIRDTALDSSTGEDYRPRRFVRMEDVERWSPQDAGDTAAFLLDLDIEYGDESYDLDELEAYFERSPIQIATSDDVDSYVYPMASVVDGAVEWLTSDADM